MASYSESSSATSNGGSLGVNCWCGMEIKLFTFKTAENPERRFYRCAKKTVDGRGINGEAHVFKWVEEVLIGELATVKSEMEDMKKMIGEHFAIEDKKITRNSGWIWKLYLALTFGAMVYLVLTIKIKK